MFAIDELVEMAGLAGPGAAGAAALVDEDELVRRDRRAVHQFRADEERVVIDPHREAAGVAGEQPLVIATADEVAQLAAQRAFAAGGRAGIELF